MRELKKQKPPTFCEEDKSLKKVQDDDGGLDAWKKEIRRLQHTKSHECFSQGVLLLEEKEDEQGDMHTHSLTSPLYFSAVAAAST